MKNPFVAYFCIIVSFVFLLAIIEYISIRRSILSKNEYMLLEDLEFQNRKIQYDKPFVKNIYQYDAMCIPSSKGNNWILLNPKYGESIKAVGTGYPVFSETDFNAVSSKYYIHPAVKRELFRFIGKRAEKNATISDSD
jgi:hypothetical protein